MQVSGINKGITLLIISLQCLSLVIDFTYLEGKDCELLVEELTAVDSGGNSVCLRDLTAGNLSLSNVRMNEAIDHGCKWNDDYIPYSELETVLHREASSAVSIYSFGPVKIEFISNPINRSY